MRLLRQSAAAGLVAICAAGAAQADGEFLQFDVSPTTANGVFSIERGRLSYAFSYSDYPGPADLNASVTYKFVVGEAAPVTFRFGPAVQYERLSTLKFGIRAIAEHYRPTSFGHVFLLGEVTSIDLGYFGLATVGFDKPDVDFEFVVQGDNAGYSDQSIAATFGLGTPGARLRAGYRFQSREAFLGMSLNSF
ncbi:MAG: hypothetical protein VX874_11755 [Pseudomonadota bacterium]|nr:hypothetical protein [Pseudomonadota bacterium]